MGNLWTNLTDAMNNLSSAMTSLLVPLAVVVLVGCGLVMMISQNLAEAAKHKIQYVIIGCVIVLGATSIVQWLGVDSCLQLTLCWLSFLAKESQLQKGKIVFAFLKLALWANLPTKGKPSIHAYFSVLERLK